MRITGLSALAVAVPATLAALVSLGLLVMAAAGHHPLWREPSLTMSEAAALDDSATVVRLMRGGEDPRARRPIRAGVLESRAPALSALEAAVAANRSRVVEVILATAAIDPETWRQGRCLAAGAEYDEILDVFDRHRPAAATLPAADCASVVRPW